MSNLSLFKNSKGFTLIELLVVISIIGMLSTVVMASLNNSRTLAIHARMATDKKTVETALEMFHIDRGQYPPYGTNSYIVDTRPGTGWATFGNSLKPYLETIPTPVYNTVVTSSGSDINAGYRYVKTTPPAAGWAVAIYDTATRAYLKCIKLTDGYMLSLMPPKIQVTNFTANDGGPDPEYVDSIRGEYTTTLPPFNPTNCDPI